MADNLDAAKLAVLAALLAKEEERRFKEKFEKGEVVIVTGVPDADDDEAPPMAPENKTTLRVDDFSAHRQVSEALSAVDKPMPTSPPPASGLEDESLEEYRYPIWAQIAPPTDTDPGAIIEGSYSAYGGTVRVYDADGHLLGVEHTDDANAAAVARRLLREKKGPNDFWRTLH
jgi:hypothetical protein